ncbi:unnamed protein product [Clonostachys byssicola]|uniref:Nucleoside phosphorylase domain-containing protein n=1 Tax=Clonostachys byssicola TaxID=160290 RepID=A0A9N9UVX0_9HYPO|nr:unnamed protein product [Clonostachys byssicola]
MAAEVPFRDKTPLVPAPLTAESLSARTGGLGNARITEQDLAQMAEEGFSEVPNYDKFYFAIICALPKEHDAVVSSAEYHWPTTPLDLNDPNVYTLAKMGGHNVVIARPLGVGSGQAQCITEALRRKFTNVALFLVVGICGGVPFFPVPQDEKDAVRKIILGDVVISSSIAQYLYQGQVKPDGFKMRNILNGNDWAMQPSPRARSLAQALEGRAWLGIAVRNMRNNLAQLQLNPDLTYSYPGAEQDRLYQATYYHKHHGARDCACARKYESCDDAMNTPCQVLCDDKHLIKDGASQKRGGLPNIHLGIIASGDIIMRSGELRDEVSRVQQAMAFEMEGAGVQIGSSSCLVIKAVCDYADSHKHKDFQEYAAGVAASAAKAVLQWYAPEKDG